MIWGSAMKHECVYDNNSMYVACSLVCVFVLFSVMRFGVFFSPNLWTNSLLTTAQDFSHYLAVPPWSSVITTAVPGVPVIVGGLVTQYQCHKLLQAVNAIGCWRHDQSNALRLCSVASWWPVPTIVAIIWGWERSLQHDLLIPASQDLVGDGWQQLFVDWRERECRRERVGELELRVNVWFTTIVKYYFPFQISVHQWLWIPIFISLV